MLKLVGLAILASAPAASCVTQPVRVDVADVPIKVPASQSRTVVSSIQDSLRYLQHEGDLWMEGKARVQDGTGCVSCHHVGYTLWSHREAERAGIQLVDGGIDDLRRRAVAFQAGQSQVVPATQMILAETHQESDTAALTSKGLPEGHWEAKGQFPSQRRSVQESNGVASLWALVALDSLDNPDAEARARRDRAIEWLAEAKDGVSNEWTAARTLVEFRLGHADLTAELLNRLRQTQRADGGWGWLEEDPSNPFSTGQSVYALAIVDGEGSIEAIRRGVDYLLAHQGEDGAWSTPSKYTSAQESEDRDYIYQFWGTAWASMGLSRVLALESLLKDPG
jgi:hypothetical protein